jgi:hemerythrin-like domain-containing protein
MAVTSRKRAGNRARTAGSSGKDAIALLKEDHKNVKELLKRLEETSDRSTSQREKLLTQVENEVKVHTTIEEEIFYPAFKEAIRSKSDAHLYFEALEEHHVVDLVMSEIKGTDTDSEEFAAKAKVLKDLIEHHAEEEETEMFPKARKAMGAARLRELGQEIEERKRQLTNGTLRRAVEAITGRRGVA